MDDKPITLFGMPVVARQLPPGIEFAMLGKNTVLARDDGSIAVADPVTSAAIRLGATPSGIPGLWNLPGFPELTCGQLLHIAGGPA